MSLFLLLLLRRSNTLEEEPAAREEEEAQSVVAADVVIYSPFFVPYPLQKKVMKRRSHPPTERNRNG